MRTVVCSLIENQPIAAADKAAIESVRTRLAEIGSIFQHTAPEPRGQYGKFSWLHEEADRLCDSLAENPSLELAERVNAAFVRVEQAEKTYERIHGSLTAASVIESAKLESLALRIIDDAEAAFNKQASDHRAKLADPANHPIFGGDELVAHDNKVRLAGDAFTEERRQARENPAMFLESHGIGIDLPPPPKPLPPVKSPARGKVDLSEPADELAKDFH